MQLQEKIDLIKNNECVAMLAPTFCIDFKYPNIIGMLKQLGFKEVTELTFGARMVNWAYANYIKEHPEQKVYISSPCPTVVAMIQTQYPELVKYLCRLFLQWLQWQKFINKNSQTEKLFLFLPAGQKKMLKLQNSQI
jgi:iron only hydrogenase large subunit-like protein